MKERILQCFNKGAETYDSAAIVQMQVAERLATRLPRNSAQTILEIGCGTGYFSQRLTDRYPEASFFLTDIAPAMVSVCKNRFSSPKIKIACIDGESLALPDQFDLITSNMTLHWFTDIKKSFEKIIERVSSAGGQFVFAMLGEHSLIEWREICENNHLQIPTPLFPSQEKLKEYFPEIKIESEIFQQPYQNVYEFLRSLKNLGATATRTDYLPLSAGKLRQLMRRFDQQINISYEILYGSYKKS